MVNDIYTPLLWDFFLNLTNFFAPSLTYNDNFGSHRNGLSQKIVIDRSMTVSEGRHHGPRCTFTKLSLTGQ